MKFTRSQLAAIDHKTGNLQLIACAGSGKTEAVARRIAELLKPGSATSNQPRNIVAFTFTEKAAAELKQRVYERCEETLGSIIGLAEMYVGTIHGFCLELLKSETPQFLKYEVLNDVQQILFVDRHSKQSGLTTSTDLNGNHLKRYVDTGRYVSALSILRESEIVQKALIGCSIVGGMDAYQKTINDRSYLDYSGILAEAVRVLRADNALRKRVKERIKHVIVDEYQDVNPIQEAVVEELRKLGASICVVGDDDQTIYQWRGSDVRNILSFEKRYAPVKLVKLEDNFRSSEGIVETARAFIEQNSQRLSKRMKPGGAQDFETGDLVALSFDNPEAEAKYIAATCKSLIGTSIKEPDDKTRGIAWSDMAVLLRSVSGNAAPITKAFRSAKIPYLVIGMNDLFETPEARACRELFYFMAERSTQAAVLKAWETANTGATLSNLKKAVLAANKSRADMQKKEERYSVYSPQRVFLDFLENAVIREVRWSHFVRQRAKVDSPMQRTIHHEDAETVFGGVQGQGCA